MGIDNYIICMDCNQGVHLGKAIRIRYPGMKRDTYGYGKIFYDREHLEPWIETIVNIEHFLMLHRTHELRVLPDLVDKFASREGAPGSVPFDDNHSDPLSNRRLFLERDVGTPDAEAEVASLPASVVERLKTF